MFGAGDNFGTLEVMLEVFNRKHTITTQSLLRKLINRETCTMFRLSTTQSDRTCANEDTGLSQNSHLSVQKVRSGDVP